jgi:hypothetical protein
MKTLGVYTKDFSLYHDLIKVLKRRNLSYISLSSMENISKRIGVILTSHKEIHDIKSKKTIAVDIYDNLDHALDLALQMLVGKEIYSKVFIGVDPGEHPGIAVVCDDILIKKTNVECPEKVVSIVKRYIREYHANEYLIRIGHGSKIIRNRIINSLFTLNISIEIVDETKTTSSHQISRSKKDGEAAASIALLSGEKVQRHLPLKPTKGDIRNIQERSRKLTDGRFSISEKTALEVLKGDINLKEAIDIDKINKKPKHF